MTHWLSFAPRQPWRVWEPLVLLPGPLLMAGVALSPWFAMTWELALMGEILLAATLAFFFMLRLARLIPACLCTVVASALLEPLLLVLFVPPEVHTFTSLRSMILFGALQGFGAFALVGIRSGLYRRRTGAWRMWGANQDSPD